MKLFKSITVLAFLFCISTSCAQWKKVRGDGNITTITRSTGEYDGLKAGGPMDFKLVEGKEGSITINGDANLMEYIITEVKDGKLVVKTKKGANLKPTKTIVVTVPYESITYVALAGSGDIDNSGTIKADDFEVALAGSGDIKLKVDSNSLESSIAGSGDIALNGSTKDLEIKIAGSGDFEGKNLDSVDVTVKISGSGEANVVCNGELKVRISGSGDVKYSGTPTNKDTKVSGSGSVRSN
ncbi:head GIN domain-containing protein [Winogradskyella sp.]|uniref:head GIN domain-containing protein n=1 Tax=Winogradskyella sp. TaxID=1883156 RepID=UPI00263977A7|nr:head GIN domain-containing protein [Winogradskyella sp.]